MAIIKKKAMLDKSSSNKIYDYLRMPSYAEKGLRRLYSKKLDPRLMVSERIKQQVLILMEDTQVGPIAGHLYRLWYPDYISTSKKFVLVSNKEKNREIINNEFISQRRSAQKSKEDDLRRKMFKKMMTRKKRAFKKSLDIKESKL